MEDHDWDHEVLTIKIKITQLRTGTLEWALNITRYLNNREVPSEKQETWNVRKWAV